MHDQLPKFLPAISLSLLFVACEKAGDAEGSGQSEKAEQVIAAPWTKTAPKENITVAEIEENGTLQLIEEDPAELEAGEIHDQVMELLSAEDFTGLDHMASGFLETKARLVNGDWKLHAFYGGFDISDNRHTAQWEGILGSLEKWVSHKPGSQTARIALAGFYVDYAWRARGSGWARDVSEEGWRLMAERLAKAGEILGAAGAEIPISDPNFYGVGLRYSMGTEQPPTFYEELIKASLKTAPDFQHSLNIRAYSLLPRWFGERGDWEAFGEYIAEENAPHGIEQYAMMVLHLDDLDSSTVRVNAINWDLFKEGMREIMRKYPDGVSEISNAAFLAAIAQDQSFAKECFDVIGDRCVVDVWKVNGRMCHYRNWANTGIW